jgi:hypothetical protein
VNNENYEYNKDNVSSTRHVLDRFEGWVQILLRSTRRGGWKKQYAVITQTRLLLSNNERDNQPTISIDFE